MNRITPVSYTHLLVEAALELPYQKTYRTVEEVYAADRAAREFVLKQI